MLLTTSTVKAELAPSLPAFMPAACLSTQVPVMAVSSDLGQAGTVLEAGTLACSGPYVIEQVELDADEGGGTFRRLVFMQSQGVIQTEVKLVAAAAAAASGSEAARKQTKRKGKGKRKGSKKIAIVLMLLLVLMMTSKVTRQYSAKTSVPYALTTTSA
jgi:hypothetical protein